ncbi:peptidase inhibitor family I36 protein [Streptomyces sp. NPDC002387]|uniref:peptidase inhibitor family I36 protein n=1 Tax=Streptomyces sp. NPDC002387 TaxID=3364643 RepID=UPI0036BB0DDC
MSLSRFAIAGAVLCSLVAFSPTAAHAQPPNLPDSANADGYLYAYNDPELEGTRCRWAGSAGTWGSCENEASSLWNNSYYGIDAVDLYWGEFHTGAHACISRGDIWGDLSGGQYHFTYGQGLSGFGDNVNDNIASHQWVEYCSQG